MSLDRTNLIDSKYFTNNLILDIVFTNVMKLNTISKHDGNFINLILEIEN